MLMNYNYTIWKLIKETYGEDFEIFDDDKEPTNEVLDDVWVFIFKDGNKLGIRFDQNVAYLSKYLSLVFHDLQLDKEQIVKVIVPRSIKEIGDGLFNNFSFLEEVILHDGIVKIGICAFYNCVCLKKINFPNDLDYIGRYAFYNCSSLEEIKLENISKVGEKAFEGSGVQKVTINGDIKHISDTCFKSCDDLYYIMLPAKVCSYFLWMSFFIDYTSLKRQHIKSILLNHSSNILLLCNNFKECMRQLENICSVISRSYIPRKEVKVFLSNFTLRIQENNLTTDEKKEIEKFLLCHKIKRVIFVSISGEILTEKNTLSIESNNIRIGGENQTLLDEINNLVGSLSPDTKRVILDKVEQAINKYKIDARKEEPDLNFGREQVFLSDSNMIGDADLYLKIELSNIKRLLVSQIKTLELLSKLEGYRKILESTVEKSTDEDNTIEEVITNIVYLASQLDENNRNQIINKVNVYLNQVADNYKVELNKELNCSIGLQFREELDPKEQLHLNLSNYLDNVKVKYDNIIPYIKLLNCLKSKDKVQEFIDSDTIENFLNNIRYLILEFKDDKLQSRLTKIFNELSEKYINQINYQLSLDDNNRISYQKFEILVREDSQLLLKQISKYCVLDELFYVLNICLKLLNEEEITNYKDTVETLLVKEILDVIKINPCVKKQKDEIFINIRQIINKYFEELESLVEKNNEHFIDVRKLLSDDLVLIKLKLDKYILEREKYNKFYIDDNREVKKLVKNKDTSIY